MQAAWIALGKGLMPAEVREDFISEVSPHLWRMTMQRKPRTADLGQYRVWYVRILNGADFLALGADARSILWPLKLRLPPFGIATFPAAAAVLAEDSALPHERSASALEELERREWVEREGNVLWLIRGLEFEPNLNPRDPNHRKYMAAVIQTLPSLSIVQRFQARYRIWFPDLNLREPPQEPSLDPSLEPSREPSEGSAEPYSRKHKAGNEGRASLRGSGREPPREPSEAGASVVVHGAGANGKALGRTRGFEDMIERGRLALTHLAELAHAEAKVEDLREQMIALAFAYWAIKHKHPNALQDPKREQTLRARLRENRNDISELLYAADGARKDRGLMGENQRGTKYDGIETIYRDRAMVEKLAALGGYEPGAIHPQIQQMMGGGAQEGGQH